MLAAAPLVPAITGDGCRNHAEAAKAQEMPRGLRHYIIIEVGDISSKWSKRSSNEESVGGEVDGRVSNPYKYNLSLIHI